MALSLQLKRNSVIPDSKEAALSGLTNALSSGTTSEGEPMIGIYNDGAEGDVKILFGIADGSGHSTIFDSEAQGVIDQIMGGNPDDAYDTIKEIADALVIINGNGEGSINKAAQDAKNYADTKINALDKTDEPVTKKFVTAVSETDGVITVSRGAVTSNGGTIALTDGDDGGINIEVVSSALTQYVGSGAIAVSAADEGEKTISLTLNGADNVLTQSADGLMANINLTWSNTDGLKLIGKDGTEIASISAENFVKDGMLDNVELKVASVEAPVDSATTGTFLVFTFNTAAGKTPIYLNVTSLIDVYTGENGIDVSGKVISAKIDSSTETFLTVGANGIKLSGVQDAINAAVTNEEKKVAKIISGVGLAADGSHNKATGNYTSAATTVVDEIAALDTALADASGKAENVQAEVDRVETAVGLGTDGSFTNFASTNYINDATSIANASVLLDTKVKANADAIDTLSSNSITGITAGNGISVSGTGNTKTVSVLVKNTDPLIEATSTGVGIKDGGVIDCGTY